MARKGKKGKKNNKSNDFPKNKAIIIGLIVLFVGWYVVNNPGITGFLIFFGIIAVIIYFLKDLIGVGILKKFLKF